MSLGESATVDARGKTHGQCTTVWRKSCVHVYQLNVKYIDNKHCHAKNQFQYLFTIIFTSDVPLTTIIHILSTLQYSVTTCKYCKKILTMVRLLKALQNTLHCKCQGSWLQTFSKKNASSQLIRQVKSSMHNPNETVVIENEKHNEGVHELL